MSGPNAASMFSTTLAVPGGPMIGNGICSGVNVVTHRVISRITEVGDVVAVQVGQQQRSQAVRAHTDRRRPLKNTAAAVHQERLPTRADQG